MTQAPGPQRRTVRDVPLAATVCLVVLGLLFTALAVVYFAEPAHDLPGLIPGSDPGVARHHVKHGLLTLALGLAVLFAAGVSSGTRTLPTGGSLMDRRRAGSAARRAEEDSPVTDAVAIAAAHHPETHPGDDDTADQSAETPADQPVATHPAPTP